MLPSGCTASPSGWWSCGSDNVPSKNTDTASSGSGMVRQAAAANASVSTRGVADLPDAAREAGQGPPTVVGGEPIPELEPVVHGVEIEGRAPAGTHRPVPVDERAQPSLAAPTPVRLRLREVQQWVARHRVLQIEDAAHVPPVRGVRHEDVAFVAVVVTEHRFRTRIEDVEMAVHIAPDRSCRTELSAERVELRKLLRELRGHVVAIRCVRLPDTVLAEISERVDADPMHRGERCPGLAVDHVELVRSEPVDARDEQVTPAVG